MLGLGLRLGLGLEIGLGLGLWLRPSLSLLSRYEAISFMPVRSVRVRMLECCGVRVRVLGLGC